MKQRLVDDGMAVAATTGVLGIGLRVVGAVHLDALPAGVSPRAAAAVYDVLTRFLHTTVRMVVALAVLFALAVVEFLAAVPEPEAELEPWPGPGGSSGSTRMA